MLVNIGSSLLAFVKKYWQYALIVALLACGWFYFHKQSTKLSDEISRLNNIHDAEIATINRVRAEEIKALQDNIAKLQLDLSDVQDKYKKQIDDLGNKKKDNVQKIIKDYNGDPTVLANQLSKSTGIGVATYE